MRVSREVEQVEVVLVEVIRHDMTHIDLTEDMTLGRRVQRSRIRVEN